MARFLFSVLPTRGHVYPVLPIGHILHRQGHAVACLTLSEFVPLFEAAGYRCFVLDEESATLLRQRRSEGEGPEALKAAFRAAFLTPLPSLVALLRVLIAEWRPDVVINDYVSFAPLLAAEVERCLLATLTMTVFSWPSPRLGPYGLGLPPSDDHAMQERYAELRTQSEGLFGEIVTEFNALRGTLGLPPRPGPLQRLTLSPFLQMVQTVPALDYERDDLPGQVHYVGPSAWDPPTALDDDLATWLAALPPARPLALVAASGAFTRSARLVEAALEALPGAGYAVLATLPFDHPLHDARDRLPELARVYRFVPHTQVLPCTRVVVTHGGFGMVTKALLHGRPLVVVPYAGDQPEVAQRVAAAGAGLRLPPGQLSGATLERAVTTVTADKGWGARAQQISVQMKGSVGPVNAAALLVRLATTGEPVVRPGTTQSAVAPWAIERGR